MSHLHTCCRLPVDVAVFGGLAENRWSIWVKLASVSRWKLLPTVHQVIAFLVNPFCDGQHVSSATSAILMGPSAAHCLASSICGSIWKFGARRNRSGGGCGDEMMFTSPDAMYIDPENCAGENSNGFVYNFVLVCYVLCSLVTLVNTAKTGNIPSIPSGCSISLRIVNVHTSPHCFPSSAVRFQDPMNGGTLVLDFCIFWLSFRVIFPEISACGPNVW